MSFIARALWQGAVGIANAAVSAVRSVLPDWLGGGARAPAEFEEGPPDSPPPPEEDDGYEYHPSGRRRTPSDVINNNYIEVPEDQAEVIEYYDEATGEFHYRTVTEFHKRLVEGLEAERSGSDEVTREMEFFGAPVRFLARRDNIRRTEAGGSFFPYLLREEVPMDLARYGIYKPSQFGRIEVDDFNRSCFTNCFRGHPRYEALLSCVSTRNVSHRDIKKAASVLGCSIEVVKERGDGRRRSFVYGDWEERETIGLIAGHYFIVETTEYLTGWVRRCLWKEDGYVKREGVKIDSFNLVRALIKRKEDYLVNHDKLALNSIHFEVGMSGGYEGIGFENIEEECHPTPEPKAPGPAKKGMEFKEVWYADLETNMSTKGSTPYLACLMNEEGGRAGWWWGEDCVVSMLRYIANKSKRPLVYFHNLGFDGKYIVKHLWRPDTVDITRGKCIQIVGHYSGVKIEFHCTLALTQMPLSSFAKAFGLESGKYENFPHHLYTRKEDTDKEYWDDDGVTYNGIPREYHTSKIEGNGLKRVVEHRKYAKDYCIRDVDVVRRGFVKFQEWSRELGIDCRYVLTAASLAHRHLMMRGCYDGVYALSGVTRGFIQKSVVGGRTALALGEDFTSRIWVKDAEHLSALDMTSLYPSAMADMTGFLMGMPRKITEEELEDESFREANGFFVMIEVTSVGKRLRMPCMSYTTESGRRVWCNDEMIGKRVVVDKVTLDEWEIHHRICYKAICGLRFDGGFNCKITEVIKDLFERRKRLKEEGNPAQALIKLIMNSAYGKSIQRPITTKTLYPAEEDLPGVLARRSGSVRDFVEIGGKRNLWKLRYDKSVVDHMSYPQVGSSVLSNSKRLMNNVMAIPEVDRYIKYTDTDSAWMDVRGLSVIEDKVPELLGTGLGQMHSDLGLSGTDPKAYSWAFVAPKTYFAVIKNDEGEVTSTVRLKGIPSKCRDAVLKEDFGGNVERMFAQIASDEGLVFDLLRGGAPRFVFTADMNVKLADEFKRRVGRAKPAVERSADLEIDLV